MKNQIKNIKIFSASLGTCLTLALTGCNSSYVRIPGINIEYEAGLVGTIDWDAIEDHVKIVTLKQGDTILEPRLMILEEYTHQGKFPCYEGVRYIDVDTGVVMLDYYYDGTPTEEEKQILEPTIQIGEDFIVEEELQLSSFLFIHNKIEKEYELEELKTFFHEEIEPDLASGKELEKRM